MTSLGNNSITDAVAITLLFLITGAILYEQHHLHFTAEAGVRGGACIDYDQSENTIAINSMLPF